MTVADRFWSKVDKRGPGGCWLWTAAKNDLGYGMFRAVPQSQRHMHRAHCWSWEMANGPISKGRAVLHTCDVRHCVNPSHLWLGTQVENLADRDAKGRNRGLVDLLAINARGGPRLGRPDLAPEQIQHIRNAVSSGTSRYVLAGQYATSYDAISNIVNLKTYKHGGRRTATRRE